MGIISLDILLEVSLLDRTLNLFLEFATVLGVVSFKSMELTSSTWFGNHHVHFRRWRRRGVVYMEDFMPDLFTAIFQGCETLYHLAYSF